MIRIAIALAVAVLALLIALGQGERVLAATGSGGAGAAKWAPSSGAEQVGGKGANGSKPDRRGKRSTSPSSSAPTSTGSSAADPALGTVNPLAIANPLCDGQLDRAERRNCKVTGSPEARYPTSNYGLETHIDTGIDNIVGNFQALLAQIANAIWIAALFVLNLVLTLLGWAFALNPFGEGRTVGEISAGLERFYRVFTSPWIVAAFAALGTWGLYKGLIQREVAASIAGMALSVVLMAGGLIVLHEPKATVGTAASFTNKAAQGVIGAPLKGSLNNPTGSYAAATSDTWRAMTLPGFAALNFSDVKWALSDADPKLVAFANRYACVDYAYLTQLSRAEAAFIVDHVDDADCPAVAKKIPAPETNAEIWLRNSSGALARDKLWDEFSDQAPYQQLLAIQGGGGAWTRLPLVILICLGLLGGIALLAWLAIRLLTATAMGFVLLLTTPLALFLPAFGERGRRSFAIWATSLVGAILAKVIYAALLAIVLFATNTVADLAGGSGGTSSMMAFLVMAGLWWAVFLKREEILSFVSVEGATAGGHGLGGIAGLYYASRMGKTALAVPLAATGLGAAGAAAAGAGGAAAAKGFLGRQDDKVEGSRRLAESQLDQASARRLDGHYKAAEQTIATQAERRQRLSDLDRQHDSAAAALGRLRGGGEARAGGEGSETDHLAIEDRPSELGRVAGQRQQLRDELRQSGPEARRAEALVAGADRRQAEGGGRWDQRQLGRAREALRREADQPVENKIHAWRAGMTPQRYESLEGREREQTHERVREQLRSDKLALGTIADRPAGIADRGGPETSRAGAKELRRAVRSGNVPDPERANQDLDAHTSAARAHRRGGDRRELGELARRPSRRPSRRGIGR